RLRRGGHADRDVLARVCRHEPQRLGVALHERLVARPVEAEPRGELTLVREDDLAVAPDERARPPLLRGRGYRRSEMAVGDEPPEDRRRQQEEENERSEPTAPGTLLGRLEPGGGKGSTRHAAMNDYTA